jgi:hypothetical protein
MDRLPNGATPDPTDAIIRLRMLLKHIKRAWGFENENIAELTPRIRCVLKIQPEKPDKRA